MTWVNNGLAVVIVLAGLYGIPKVCVWIGQNMGIPLRDAAINHLNKTNDLLEQNCETQRQTQKTMETIATQMATKEDIQSFKQAILECQRVSQ